ncbi:hypothetical protein CDL12_28636 [Handroanthus impetiginosus]|uniref:Uncharacterized protein n=1 Tax=Handroanthus impetiginosus TaxID=429701 RepID=A0A2G9G0Q8_9LAMI|nr:hypothetical protein CDL12_28636 [Handroanthus impetiginosus]
MTEGSASSLDLESIELRHDEAVLSPEDVAWADSCFIKDPDISGSGWDSLRYALLETFSVQDHSSPNKSNNSLEHASMEIPSSEDANDIRISDEPVDSIAATTEEAEPNNDNPLNQEKTDDFWSSHRMEDIFLPTYNESLRNLGLSESELDFVFEEVELEQSTEDIFKIWDLDIPPEEDELIKQLNKALTESSLKRSEDWKGLQDESLDDLISGIAELALGADSD